MKQILILLLIIEIFFVGCKKNNEEYVWVSEDEFYVTQDIQAITNNIFEIGCVTTLTEITEYSKIILEIIYDDFDDNVLLSIKSDDINRFWNVTTLEENSKFLIVDKSNCQIVSVGSENQNVLHNDVVSNNEIALKISKTILSFVYGDEIYDNSSVIIEKYDSELNLWYIKSKLNEEGIKVGGNCYIIFCGHDCEVKQIWLTQ